MASLQKLRSHKPPVSRFIAKTRGGSLRLIEQSPAPKFLSHSQVPVIQCGKS